MPAPDSPPPSEGLAVKRILAPVDFSSAGLAALASADSLALHFGATVTLFHVLEPVSDDPDIVLHWAEFPEQRRALAYSQLEQLSQALHASGSTIELAEGRAFDEILRRLAGGAHDLVAMGQSGGQRGFIQGLLGSTVERVARHSPIPLLVVGADHLSLQQPPRCVLVSTDLTESSFTAFPWAEALSRRYGTGIVLANIQSPLELPGTQEYSRHGEQIDALREAAEDRLREVREQQLSVDLDVTTEIREGTPARALCRLARDLACDLILISTRGSQGWRRSWLGGTTEMVLRHAPCPVVIIPPPGARLSDLLQQDDAADDQAALSTTSRAAPSRTAASMPVDLAAPISTLMRQDFPVLRHDATIAQALATIRQHGIADRTVYFYVTDPGHRLVGVIPTRRLLTSDLAQTVGQHMIQKVTVLRPNDTVLDASEIFSRHKFLALPVVDADQRILGVVDVGQLTEQIFDLAEREQMEEMFESIGFNATQVREASPFRAFRFRFPWLLATITSGTACALLTSVFELTLAKSIVLAFFMTLILGLGESVSIQSMTVAIQALRSTRPTLRWYLAALRKESLTALLLGGACGSLVALIVWLWRGEPLAAASIGSSITLALLTACAIGLSVPAALHAARLDPKIAAGPITLALTDIFTLVFYFTLASWLL
jgi:magnesium transporter